MNKENCELVVIVGAGGVGKTTISALWALKEAKAKRVLVITVDPARRLLDALGLKSKAKSPVLVKLPSHFSGQLSAFMPDLEKEWDDFLKAAIKDTSIRHDITKNPFFLHMLEGLPGAFEIICSHIMFRLKNSKEYDVIVLDTPPSSQAQAFFLVPQKIANVLEQDIFRLLVGKKVSFAKKLMKKMAFFSSGLLEKTIEKLIGTHLFSQLLDFAISLDSLYEPLLQRTKLMNEMFLAKNTKFILTVSPTWASLRDALELKENLYKMNIKIDEIIVNMISPNVSLKINKYFDNLVEKWNDEERKEVEKYLDFMNKKIEKEQKIIKDIKTKFNNIPSKELEKISKGDIWSLFNASFGN